MTTKSQDMPTMTRAEATKSLMEGKQVECVSGAYSETLEWHAEHGMVVRNSSGGWFSEAYCDGVTYRLIEPKPEPRTFLGRWIECEWEAAEWANEEGSRRVQSVGRAATISDFPESKHMHAGETWVKRIEQPVGIPVKELRDILSTFTPTGASRLTFNILSTLCDKYEAQPAPEPRDKRRD